MTSPAVALAAVLVVGACLVTIRRTIDHLDRPGAPSSVCLHLSLLWTTGVVVLGLVYGATVTVDEGATWLSFGLLVALVASMLAWATFAFEYTGRGPTVTGIRALVLALLGSLAVASPLVAGELTGTAQLVTFLVASVVQLMVLSLAGIGVFLVVRSSVTYDDLPSDRAVVLVIGGSGVVLLAVPVSVSDVLGVGTMLGLLLALVATIAGSFFLAQRRYGMFALDPIPGHLAREIVFDTIPEAVVVTDREHRILDANRTAMGTFGIDRATSVGRPMDETIGYDRPAGEEDAVSLETADGRREFEVRSLSLSDGRSGPVGHAYRFRDVTDRHTHEQRLDVLNRVLRHNLRNDLDAIRGFAEALGEDRADEVDPTELAERIRSTSRGVVALGDTVERVERLLSAESPSREPVDVLALVESVAEGLPSESITHTASDPSLRVVTDGDVLRMVVEELLENAAKHTDRASPAIGVAVAERADGVSIRIRDDGPGIPDRERAVLTDGEETPLRHGSGLGLWLVSWGVSRLGGTLEFAENDPRGSVVSLRIPDLHSTGATRSTAYSE